MKTFYNIVSTCLTIATTTFVISESNASTFYERHLGSKSESLVAPKKIVPVDVSKIPGAVQKYKIYEECANLAGKKSITTFEEYNAFVNEVKDKTDSAREHIKDEETQLINQLLSKVYQDTINITENMAALPDFSGGMRRSELNEVKDAIKKTAITSSDSVSRLIRSLYVSDAVESKEDMAEALDTRHILAPI